MTGYCSAIWRCRYFWLSLVRMDLHQRYRGSVLGVFWSLLQPLALTTLFTFLFAPIFSMPRSTYFLYVLTGLAFWSFLHASLVQGCRSFLVGEHYIRQHPAPMAIYSLRTILGAGFHLAVALVAALILSFSLALLSSQWTSSYPLALLSLIPSFLLLLIFAWAVATLAGLAHVFFRDTGHLCEVGLQVLFYLTPIVYPRSLMDQRGFAWLTTWNPFIPLLDLLRNPLVDQSLPSLATFVNATIVVGALLSLALVALARLERRLIFRL